MGVTDVSLTIRVHENGSTKDVDAQLADLVDEGLIDELIQTDENLGGAGSRRLLLEETDIETDYVLILDDDMYVDDGWDHTMLPLFESDPDIGMIGAPFMIPGTNEIRDGGRIMTWGSGIPAYDADRDILIRDQADYSALADPDVSSISVDSIPIGSALVRTDVLSDVSLPDRQTFEDIAFCLDVANAGWEIVMSCETIFYHDKRTEDDTNRNRTDWNAKLEGYRDFCEKRNLRFALPQHILHEGVFRVPNRILWVISDIKNRKWY
ncbi:Glycosyl transferase family 2 [Halapricum desulfuricans]|uniref:Glycosyl transferase family 2 n=1 Tax=Halapricum desulfuricans TaxID=2841257 RepID=A0A897NQB2_9EURY|nr:Glycosyl transferase family 2 [Halapricum desulfuricans]